MKKLILISAAIILLTSFKQDMSSNISNQVTKAFLSYKGTAMKTTATKGGKPFKSSGSGTISYNFNGCGDGTLQLQSSGGGNSTHLGLFTQSTTVCIDLASGELIGDVVGVGKAANGDKVYYLFVGAGIDPGAGLLFQDYVITGGSGRFSGASGDMRLLYQVNTPTDFAYTGTGTISY